MDKNICVLCSSRDEVPKKYHDIAKNVGKLLAQRGYNIVFGACISGLMGSTCKTAYEHGSILTGINLEVYNDTWDKCQNKINVIDIFDRIKEFYSKSDAFLFMPGGIGTLFELHSTIEAKRTGYHNKPIIIINPDGFYDGTMMQFDTIVEQSFGKPKEKELFIATGDYKKAVNYIDDYFGIRREESARNIDLRTISQRSINI